MSLDYDRVVPTVEPHIILISILSWRGGYYLVFFNQSVLVICPPLYVPIPLLREFCLTAMPKHEPVLLVGSGIGKLPIHSGEAFS